MEEVPFDDRRVPRVEVDWERSLWWWYPLTRAIHPAVRMNALVLGLIAVLLAQAGASLGAWLFQPDWQPQWQATSLAPSIGGTSWRIMDGLGGYLQALLSFQSFGARELAFVTFELLWLTMTLGLLGGVLARRSLVELGQRTVAAWGESCSIVCSRWQSYLWYMGMHLVGICGLLLPILVAGWLSRFGVVGATIAGVFLIICFPLVFAIGRFALSATVCFPLGVCAIAAEKRADAFEGFSRSNAYFFQRPVVTGLCVLALFAVGKVGELLVFWTITFGWWMTRGAYLFAGGTIQPASNSYVAAGNWLAAALIAAFWFSFFWSASAATYLVLRKSVDNTDLDEIDSIESPLERTLPDIPGIPKPSGPADGTDSDSADDEGSDPVR